MRLKRGGGDVLTCRAVLEAGTQSVAPVVRHIVVFFTQLNESNLQSLLHLAVLAPLRRLQRHQELHILRWQAQRPRHAQFFLHPNIHNEPMTIQAGLWHQNKIRNSRFVCTVRRAYEILMKVREAQRSRTALIIIIILII